MPSKRVKRVSALFAIIYGALVIYILLLLFVEPFQQAATRFMTFFHEFPAAYAMFWVFLFMVIGTSTNIPVGIAALFFFSKSISLGPLFWWEVILFSIAAGFGAGTGQIMDYAIGRGAAVVLKDNKSVKNLQYLAKLMTERPALTPFLVFLFALTPLPDQPLVIPLGMVKYPLKRMYLPCCLGKGLLAFSIVLGSIMFNIGAPDMPEVGTMIIEAILLVAIISAIILILMIDWEGIFTRRVEKAAARSTDESMDGQVASESMGDQTPPGTDDDA